MIDRRIILGLAGAVTLAGCDGGEEAALSGPATAASETASVDRLSPGDRPLPAYLRCLQEEGVTVVSAHRGGPGRGAPENALSTFRTTFAAAPVVIEADVRATADGELVLFHDEELSRRSTCTGDLEDRDFASLAECSLRDFRGTQTPARIGRLDDALAWAAGRTILQLDVKELALMEDVVDAVRAADAENDVILITYTPRAAERVARLDRDIMISASVDRVSDLDRLENAGVDLSRVLAWTGTDAPDAALFAEIRRRGSFVIFGTLGPTDRSIDGEIDRSGDIFRYVDIAETGVDILATDRPISAFGVLARDPAYEAGLAACAE